MKPGSPDRLRSPESSKLLPPLIRPAVCGFSLFAGCEERARC